MLMIKKMIKMIKIGLQMVLGYGLWMRVGFVDFGLLPVIFKRRAYT